MFNKSYSHVLKWNWTEFSCLFARNNSLKTEIPDKKEQLLYLTSGELILLVSILSGCRAIFLALGAIIDWQTNNCVDFVRELWTPLGKVKSRGLELNELQKNTRWNIVTVRFALLFELTIAFVSSPLPSRWAVRPYWSVQLCHWFMTLPESTHKIPVTGQLVQWTMKVF